MLNYVWYAGMIATLKGLHFTDYVYLVYHRASFTDNQRHVQIYPLARDLTTVYNIETSVLDTVNVAYEIENKITHYDRILFIILHSDSEMHDFFDEILETPNPMVIYSKWLILTHNITSMDDYFKDIFIAFPCEVQIAFKKDNDKVDIWEAYFINETSNLIKNHYGTWSQKKKKFIDLQSKFLSHRRNDFKGATIDVATYSALPLVKLSEVNGEPKIVGGYFGEVWNQLEIMLNFTTKVTTRFNASSAPFESPADLINLVAIKNNSLSVGIQGITVTEKRMDKVHFTEPLVTSRNVLVIKQTSKEIHWYKFMKPFSLDVWWSLAASIVLAPIVVMVLQYVANRIDYPNMTHIPLVKLFLDIYGAYCQQGCDAPPTNLSSRVVYLSAFLSAVVVLAAYSASLISSLAVQTYTVPFHSFQEFLAVGTHKLGIIINSYEYALFYEANITVFNKIKERGLLESEDEMPRKALEGLMKVCAKDNYAFFIDDNIVQYLRKFLDCDVLTIDFGVRGLQTLALVKRYPFRDLIRTRLLDMRDFGMLSRFARQEYTRYVDDPSPVDAVDMLSVFPIFAFLLIGVIASTIILILECLYKKKQKNKVEIRTTKILTDHWNSDYDKYRLTDSQKRLFQTNYSRGT